MMQAAKMLLRSSFRGLLWFGRIKLDQHLIYEEGLEGAGNWTSGYLRSQIISKCVSDYYTQSAFTYSQTHIVYGRKRWKKMGEQ